MKEFLNLFMAFFRIGAFTFGGGYAMLPMLQKEVVEKYHWATEDEIMDYFAIGQCIIDRLQLFYSCSKSAADSGCHDK